MGSLVASPADEYDALLAEKGADDYTLRRPPVLVSKAVTNVRQFLRAPPYRLIDGLLRLTLGQAHSVKHCHAFFLALMDRFKILARNVAIDCKAGGDTEDSVLLFALSEVQSACVLHRLLDQHSPLKPRSTSGRQALRRLRHTTEVLLLAVRETLAISPEMSAELDAIEAAWTPK